MSKATPTLMTAVLLGGCASGLSGLRPLTYQEPGETRVLVSHKACPHKSGENFAPILAGVGLEVASQLIKGFGTALSKGAEGGALPSSVSTTNIELGSLPQCLIIIRGRFSADKEHSTPVALPQTADPAPLAIVKRDGSTSQAVLPVVYDLQHYIELQLLASQNNTAMTFGPALIHVARSMDGAEKGDRALSIAVKFDRPGHQAVGSAVLIGNRRIGDMDAYPLDPRNHMLYEAPWFAIIGGAPAAAGAAPAGGTQGTGQLPTVPGGSDSPAPAAGDAAGNKPAKAAGTANGPFPYTLTTTVIETRPTKEFLAFVASAFTAVQPKLIDEIKGEIDPAAREVEATTSLDKQVTYTSTFADAQTSLIAYCALTTASARSDLITKSAAARNAQLAANKAALLADLTPPFAQLVEVSSSDPVGVVACEEYR